MTQFSFDAASRTLSCTPSGRLDAVTSPDLARELLDETAAALLRETYV